MKYTYKTNGTCASRISFDLEDGIIKNVEFTGGCNGNTQGIGKLVEGMSADDIVKKCSGIKCGFRPTSCPDQLAKAIAEAIDNEK